VKVLRWEHFNQNELECVHFVVVVVVGGGVGVGVGAAAVESTSFLFF